MAEENQDDWLSKLPDEVLLNIVERLGIADAARTSVLSRRWKQIPAMLSKIVITVDSFERKHKRRKLTSDDDDDDMVRANTAVLEATKSILKRRAESVCTIHLLSVGFYLGDESIFFGLAVANTIATQKVASVEFAILTKVRRRCTNNDMLTYGRQFMTFFDSCPNTFSGLARLSLENLRLGESDFPKNFTICKQLEFLYIYRCDMGIMSLLEVEHPQLPELVIAFINLNRVDLKWVPKLTMVKFDVFISQHDPFCLGYVPLLQTVSIINMGRSWQKMLNLSELLGKTAISNLHLDFKCEKIWVKPEGRRQLLPVFHKLKVVNLINISEECDLTWTMFILQGAPSLKELGVMVLNHWCGMILGKRRKMYNFSEEKDKGLEWEPSASDFKHHGLAELRICGRFKGEEKIASYARCVMEAAVNLEDIKLYNNPACENRKHKVPKEWTRKQKLSLRNKITEGMSSLVRIHFPGIGQAFP